MFRLYLKSIPVMPPSSCAMKAANFRQYLLQMLIVPKKVMNGMER